MQSMNAINIPASPDHLETFKNGDAFDVVVVGAGGAGMAAALFAAIDGARVALVESTSQVGGTTAFAGGTNWVPGNSIGAHLNPDDSLSDAERFLDAVVGEHSDPRLRRVFLENAAAAVDKIVGNSQVRYYAKPVQPDYISAPGAITAGRALEPMPFNGKRLGKYFNLVRYPLPQYTILGGMMVGFDDLPYLLNWNRNWRSFSYTMSLVARYACDRISMPRGARLVLGNALVGRLLLSLLERKVTIFTSTHVREVERDSAGISTVSLDQDGVQRTFRLRGGLIAATGGFPRHPEARRENGPGNRMEWSATAPGNTGQMHALAKSLGAHYGDKGLTTFFWTPLSLIPQGAGASSVFPHFSRDLTKPRTIVVDQNARRFGNEASVWHDFAHAMTADRQRQPSFLITDWKGLMKNGFGIVRPGGSGLKGAIRSGYLVEATSIRSLAAELDLDPDVLQQTMERFNQFAKTGRDADFKRGETAYEKLFGDPGSQTNRNLGPIEHAPFFAIRLYPGDIGTARGFVCDEFARALDRNGDAIKGLYFCGNDFHSIVGGVYAAPGVTIGPGLVFSYIAARDAVRRAGMVS